MGKPKEMKRREAQERQERWDNMNPADRLLQKIEQGNGDTAEAARLMTEVKKIDPTWALEVCDPVDIPEDAVNEVSEVLNYEEIR